MNSFGTLPPDPAGLSSGLTTSPLSIGGDRFLADGKPFVLRGICVQPGPPSVDNGLPLSPPLFLRTLDKLAGLGFNALRFYLPPSPEIAGECVARGFRLLLDLPWNSLCDFIGMAAHRRAAVEGVVSGVQHAKSLPGVLGLLVANEISPHVCRYAGWHRVAKFLDHLTTTARRKAPGLPVGYAGYPPTEPLLPGDADFACMNIYLDSREALRRYLRRLKVRVAGKPLVVGEFGLDALRNGTEAQSDAAAWFFAEAEDAGCAGAFWFSLGDNWWRGGHVVAGWSFGLTDSMGEPTGPALSAAGVFSGASSTQSSSATPRVSVVVCARNAEATLAFALRAIGCQEYANWECVVVDDGSTDGTAEIARRHPFARLVQTEGVGLGAARNIGAAEARGEIIAFTDADCEPFPDWLVRLVSFMEGGWDLGGGPNLTPPASHLAAGWAASAPGLPCAVLRSDEHAEHLPGCNLAVRREAFAKLGGFDALFTTAGDDVDFCWRAEELGLRMGYASGACVWHHRRTTIGAYLRQQAGYGASEARLAWRHGEDRMGGSGARWQGVVYEAARLALRGDEPAMGRFGTAFYAQEHPSAKRTGSFRRRRMNLSDRLQLGVVGLLQPLVRSLARLAEALRVPTPARGLEECGSGVTWNRGSVVFVMDQSTERSVLLRDLQAILVKRGWFAKANPSTAAWDIEVALPCLRVARLHSMVEVPGGDFRGSLFRLRIVMRSEAPFLLRRLLFAPRRALRMLARDIAECLVEAGLRPVV